MKHLESRSAAHQCYWNPEFKCWHRCHSECQFQISSTKDLFWFPLATGFSLSYLSMFLAFLWMHSGIFSCVGNTQNYIRGVLDLALFAIPSEAPSDIWDRHIVSSIPTFICFGTKCPKWILSRYLRQSQYSCAFQSSAFHYDALYA